MLLPVRFIARLLLGLAFIVLGWDAAREPGGRVEKAASIGVPSPALAVRANGALMVTAGSTLALGVLPRVSAFALAASLIPTTLAGHRYWEDESAAQRAGNRIHFMKNLSLIGGLLFVALESHD